MNSNAVTPIRTPRSSRKSQQEQVAAAEQCNVRVMLRCRPMNDRERRKGSKEVIQCNDKRNEVTINPQNRRLAKTFTFDGVFGIDSTQAQVYNTAVRPVVDDVLLGFNCTVFAYGQTGTGKTFTMEGGVPGSSERTQEHWELNSVYAGVIPRAIHHIFTDLEGRNTEYAVRVSHLELYNEELRDLLSSEDDGKQLKLYDDGNRGVLVTNLEEVLVSSAEDISAVLQKSAQLRQTAETKLNQNSSRSHCIFIITIHMKQTTTAGEDVIKIGKLNLVDLAGSENIARSGAQNMRQREAGNINQSLLTLGRVITALTDNHPHVPYRESKLTRLLQESLGGRAKTAVIATISASSDSYDETLSTLEYAHRAKKIKNTPEVNQTMTKRALISEYENEIERLKAALTAARTKNGVYLPPAEYDALMAQIRGTSEQASDLQSQLELKHNLINEISEALKQTEQELLRKKSQLRSKEEELVATQRQLNDTLSELSHTKHILAATEAVVSEHEVVEKRLRTRVSDLRSEVERAGSEMLQLHEKIDRAKVTEEHNARSAKALQATVNDRLCSVEKGLVEFSESEKRALDAMRAELDAFVEGGRKSNVRIEQSVEELAGRLALTFDEVRDMVTQYQQRTTAAVDNSAKQAKELDVTLNEIVDKLSSRVDSATRAFSELTEQHSEATKQWVEHAEASAKQVQYRVETFVNSQLSALNDSRVSASNAMSSVADRAAQHCTALSAFREAQDDAIEREQKVIVEKVSNLLQSFVTTQQNRLQTALSRVQNELTLDAESLDQARDSLRESCDRSSDAVGYFASNFSTMCTESNSALRQHLQSQSEFTEECHKYTVTEMNSLYSQHERTNNAHQTPPQDSMKALTSEHKACSSEVWTKHRTESERNVKGLREFSSKFYNQHNFELEKLSTDLIKSKNSVHSMVNEQLKELAAQTGKLEDDVRMREQAWSGIVSKQNAGLGEVNTCVQGYIHNHRRNEPTGGTPAKRTLALKDSPIVMRSKQSIIDEFLREQNDSEKAKNSTAKRTSEEEQCEPPASTSSNEVEFTPQSHGVRDMHDAVSSIAAEQASLTTTDVAMGQRASMASDTSPSCGSVAAVFAAAAASKTDATEKATAAKAPRAAVTKATGSTAAHVTTTKTVNNNSSNSSSSSTSSSSSSNTVTVELTRDGRLPPAFRSGNAATANATQSRAVTRRRSLAAARAAAANSKSAPSAGKENSSRNATSTPASRASTPGHATKHMLKSSHSSTKPPPRRRSMLAKKSS